jgi:putative hemolysin
MYRIFLMAASLAMSACSSTVPGAAPAQPQAAVPTVGMANPASVHCTRLGGRPVIDNTPKGQVGMCHLPDGSVQEEWALYRRDHR